MYGRSVAFATPARLREIQQRLLAWFQEHARDLPFRHERSPYRVLVAEMMLQQTQAATVGPYLERFCARFPTPEALAAAPLQEVLALWQGLGYYRRARYLHAAAVRIVQEHGGVVPCGTADLRRLPGVGPYVAAAVASFAFGRDEPAVDANARRVLARVGGVSLLDDALARAFVPSGQGAAWNEAVMDLGALVCLPRSPRCGGCPLLGLCSAQASGRTAELPARRPRPVRPSLPVLLLAICDVDGRFGLERRPETGLLAGMWGFPTLEGSGGSDPVAVAAGWGIRLRSVEALQPFRHVFTHRVWEVRPFAAVGEGPLHWVAPKDVEQLPMAGPSVRVLRQLAAGASGQGCEGGARDGSAGWRIAPTGTATPLGRSGPVR